MFFWDWEEPAPLSQVEQKYRIVLITQDIDTPFWDEVSIGAKRQAEEDGSLIEVWGSYGSNQDDFLQNIELAIHSKVDGIIVQGLDQDEFIELTKIKAAFYSIPIITIANDVPMEESLRRTYVGSDQYHAGQLIAGELITDMGVEGEVILFYDQTPQYYQKQRLKGIHDVLDQYPEINIINAESSKQKEDVMATTRDILNQHPNVDAFIVVNAQTIGGVVQEIGRRKQVESHYIYSFDDGADSVPLLKEGKLDRIIQQSPMEMGRLSVQLLVEWLNGETVPLDIDGYFTDIEVVKAMDLRE